MGKSEEGIKLLHILKPAIAIIPEIEPPLGAVLTTLFRSPSTLSRSGLASLCSSTCSAAKSPSSESSKVTRLIPSTG